MPLINFELIRLKRTIQLDVPLTSTLTEVSDLIFKILNIDLNDFPNKDKLIVKFIYKKKIFFGSKTLESMQFDSDLKVNVFFPKPILDELLSRGGPETEASSETQSNESTTTETTEKSEQKQEEKTDDQEFTKSETNPPFVSSTQFDSSTHQSVSNKTDQSNMSPLEYALLNPPETNESEVKSELSKPPNFIQPFPQHVESEQKLTTYLMYSPQPILPFSSPEYDETIYHQLVLNCVHPTLIKSMTELNFDAIDSAYALCYKNSKENAVNLIINGIASDPKFRYHLNMIIGNIYSSFDERLQHEIELAKFDAKMKNENEMVAIACAIKRHAASMPIEDPRFGQHLQFFVDEVDRMHPGQIHQKIIDDERELMELTHQNNNEAVSRYNEVNEEFQAILSSYPQMTPDNFVNPYLLLYDDLIMLNQSDQGKAVVEYAKTFDYKQLGFVYRIAISNMDTLNEAIQILQMFNGDVGAAETFIKENH